MFAVSVGGSPRAPLYSLLVCLGFFFLCFLLFLQHVSAALSQVLALSA